jgi:glycosyltransferase involved in cell wall biosynthesis
MDDFVIISISNSVEYPYEKLFFDRCKDKCKDLNIRFLRNLPRQDIISAFKCSDVFVFTSGKEVAPLVILESMAAGLPWVSFNVDSLYEKECGMVISNNIGKIEKVDKKGYVIVDDNLLDQMTIHIYEILMKDNLRKSIQHYAAKEIKDLDWNNIAPLYDRIFRNE